MRNTLCLLLLLQFYEDKDGKEKPGKKGISLSSKFSASLGCGSYRILIVTVEHWNALKERMDSIDEFIAKLS